MKDLDIVVCGLIVADIIGRPVDLVRPPARGSLRLLDEIRLFSGGNVCNVGIALAKLGLRVGAISRVGDDAWKEFALAELKRYRVDCRGVRIESPRPTEGKPTQTSATMVCVDKGGERTLFHVLGANAKITSADLLQNLPLLRRAKILLVGYYGLLPALEPDLPKALATLKKKTRSPQRPFGIEIALDTGGSALHRNRLTHLGRCLKSVDYFLPSYDEARALTGKNEPRAILDTFQATIKNRGPKVLGIKLGERGCFLRESGMASPQGSARIREHLIPAFHVKKVVDTTGAGDCFLAGFLAATLRGFSAYEAGRFGNRVGACCIEKLGATAGVQSFETTRELLRS